MKNKSKTPSEETFEKAVVDISKGMNSEIKFLYFITVSFLFKALWNTKAILILF